MAEPKRPYYVKPKRGIVLQVVSAIVKPLRVSEDGVVYRLIVPKPPKSDAAKRIIDG